MNDETFWPLVVTNIHCVIEQYMKDIKEELNLLVGNLVSLQFSCEKIPEIDGLGSFFEKLDNYTERLIIFRNYGKSIHTLGELIIKVGERQS